MVRKVAVDLGLDLYALVDGLRVPVHELEHPSEGCRWDDFAALCDRLHAVLGDDGMLAGGRRFLEIPKVAAFARIGAAFASPRGLYRMGVRYSPSTFTVVSAHLSERSPVEVDVELVVRPDARDSRGFFVFNAGVLAAIPRMIGLSDAVVEARYEQRRGQYRVVHPPSRSVWMRLRHLFIALTSARHAYDELRAHNDALLTRLQELEQARTLAETASTTKTRFMANVSHELRTPMNGVLGMIEVLDTTPLSAEQRSYLDSLRASADGLLEVIDGFLDFSRLESSRLELARAPYDPARLVHELVAILQQRAQGRGLVIRLRAAPTLPAVVVGDAERVRLVLHHLVRNAVTFTERGVVEVRAWADAQHLVFEVEDTGPGIDERWRAQLFRPFVQVDDSLTRRHGGSGLGLAICRQVVELMGGQIDYRSQLGVGSTFWFRIPRADASTPELSAPLTPDPASRASSAPTPHSTRPPSSASLPPLAYPSISVPAPSSLPPTPLAAAGSPDEHAPPASPPAPLELPGELRVLVVDDNVLNQRVLLSMLERLGLRADVADNGKLGVEADAAGPYDLIFMDCQMPVMNGFDATRIIRAARAQQQPLIIAVTAHAIEGYRQLCVAAGMDAFISKPVKPLELRAVLEQYKATLVAQLAQAK
jgi:signal transduction histidine kinase